jgi:hypothetical protein
MRTFQNWYKEIIIPVIVNVCTALVLFMAAMMFKPVRQWLFPPEDIREYPLICTAEPVIDTANNELIVEFFIINRSKDEYSREDLSQFLVTRNPDPGVTISPDIELKYWRIVDDKPLGRIGKPYLEADFNRGKGEVNAVVDEKENTVRIRMDHINRRAIIKVSIPIFDLPGLEGMDVQRTNK